MLPITLAGKAPMPQPKRRLVAAGKLARFADSDCLVGYHVGHPVDIERMNAAGGMWASLATCSECGGTVPRRQFVGQGVAMDDVLRAMGSE